MRHNIKSLFITIALACLVVTACEKEEITIEETADGTSHEELSDYEWDSDSEIQITLNETSISSGSANVSIDGSVATITAEGNYNISGTLSNGQIIVDAGDSALVRLILNSVNITNSSNPALFIKNSDKTIIYLTEETTNTLTDGSNYSSTDDELNAALFSKSDLTIFGEGTLTVQGNYADGITSKDGLLLASGNYNITTADDGIRGKDYLIIEDGTYTINSGGDGLKSDNDASDEVGYIKIIQGTFTIVSNGDGISAQTDVYTSGNGTYTITTAGGSAYAAGYETSAKGIKGLNSVTIDNGNYVIYSADDAIHSNNEVVINNGTFEISSADDGIHADASITVNNGTISIEKSYEGIESKYITINTGNIWVVSTDDSFNATAGSRTESDDNSHIYIKGGYIVLNASEGDGLDSNGSIDMTDGTVIIHGPSSEPEVMIDYNGTYKISGGFLISSGSLSNMTQAPSTSSSQYSLKIFFSSSISSSTLFHLEDSEGNNIVTFEPEHQYQSVVFSSSELQNGETYSIYTGGSSTGTSEDGLYSGGAYSNGTLYETFTISGVVTTIGSSSSGGGGGGPGF